MTEIFDQASHLRYLMDQERFNSNRPFLGKIATMIALGGAKGGVGKSSLAVNLAWALSQKKKKVLLFDANYGLGNLDILLGVCPEKNLIESIRKGVSLEEVLYPVNENITLISAGTADLNFAEVTAFAVEGFYLELEKILGRYDYVVFDVGSGLRERQQSLFLNADLLYLVTTGEPTSLTDTYATIKMIVQRDPSKKISLWVNRVSNDEAAEMVFKKLNHVTQKYLSYSLEGYSAFREDLWMEEAARKQKPLMSFHPQGSFSKSVHQVALNLSGERIGEETQGIKAWMKGLLSLPSEQKSHAYSI